MVTVQLQHSFMSSSIITWTCHDYLVRRDAILWQAMDTQQVTRDGSALTKNEYCLAIRSPRTVLAIVVSVRHMNILELAVVGWSCIQNDFKSALHTDGHLQISVLSSEISFEPLRWSAMHFMRVETHSWRQCDDGEALVLQLPRPQHSQHVDSRL